MTYDIGIGLCAGFEDELVVVKLDSAMVNKLAPRQPWGRLGTSLLRLDSGLCSPRRPLEPGAEVYLDRAALSKGLSASLDLAGSDTQVTVDLRALLRDLDPQPPPHPVAKSRSARW